MVYWDVELKAGGYVVLYDRCKQQCGLMWVLGGARVAGRVDEILSVGEQESRPDDETP